VFSKAAAKFFKNREKTSKLWGIFDEMENASSKITTQLVYDHDGNGAKAFCVKETQFNFVRRGCKKILYPVLWYSQTYLGHL